MELSGVAGVPVSSAVAMLVELVRVIGGGEPCVVVAHSQGGTAAAELAPYLFAHLVYVGALAPVADLPCGAYSSVPENRNGLVLRLLRAVPATVGAVRIDPGDRDAHAAILEISYGDVDEAAVIVAISLLGADGPLGMRNGAFVVMVDWYGGAVPCTYGGLHEGQRHPGTSAMSLLTRDRGCLERAEHRPRSRQLALAVPGTVGRSRHRHRGLCRRVRYVILRRSGAG
ncbi:hypothetical protein [Streptomyces rimosus]|uniref:hypothetical protein n=1 Tax=Streptomyces rimosus TaxID=1927 RepID=UPI0037BD79FF